MEVKVRVKNLSKYYDSSQKRTVALDNVSLDIGQGEFLCLLGPSGCGKSTLLRILAGIYEQSEGQVEFCHPPAKGVPANSMVFQEYALFPWRNVIDNVAFGLENLGIPRDQRYQVSRRFLEKVGLSDFEHAYPHQLSGGMKQRVSIARAFATDPDILLMDEPLGALDAQTRNILQEELMRIWEESRKTVVYVTHSIEEAILLGDRIAVFTARPGRIKAIYDVDIERPRSQELRTDHRFAELYNDIWHCLREEVERTMKEMGKVR